MEILLSWYAPTPQCGSSPRRLPAVGTGLNGPGTPYAESQSTEREGIFPLQASLDFCTSPEQGITILLQADAGVDDDETTTSDQAAACEELRVHRRSGRSKGWQHGVTTKPSSLIREGDEVLQSFLDALFARIFVFLCYSVFMFFLLLVRFFFPSSYGRRGDFSIKDGNDWDAQTKCVNCCTRTGAHIVTSICINEGYNLYRCLLSTS